MSQNAARRQLGIHGWRSNSESVRRLYAGPAGAILRTLSHLSLHVPLSKYWLRDHTYDRRGATRILDAGCGAGQLTEHLAQYAASDASNLILEGLFTDDLKSVADGSQTLLKMPSEAKWRVSNDIMYRRYSTEFLHAVEELQKEAESNDIDGASMAWVNFTMKWL